MIDIKEREAIEIKQAAAAANSKAVLFNSTK